MGMYTELIFGATVKDTIPQEVKDVLHYLFDEEALGLRLKPKNLPNHPFFKCDRWDFITSCSSYYFAVRNTHCSIQHDDISNTYNLSSRANLKNYDNEIAMFLDWIKPYIEQGSGTRDFYAIVCYEEQAEPTIYYLKEKE
jgi:hypothetical protein